MLKPGGRFLAVDFEPSESQHAHHLMAHLLGHRIRQIGLRELAPVLADAGFTDVETGRTKMRILSYLRGRAG